MKRIFYKPEYGWPADAIPYYENGLFHIFYLLDYRDGNNVGTPWFKITTKDFVNFEDHGEMLARGTEKEYDQYVFTGSVIKDADGKYHIWYTGHNTCMDKGNYVQAVMHAVSDDLEKWTKIPEDTFVNLTDEYEFRDWRDPFVWYDEEEKKYYMLLSTRKKDMPSRRRGTTALLCSDDNKKWSLCEPFWAPELYYAHECPDLFKIGKWYYHVYSEFSHYNTTRYVMSKSLKGPWIQPADDAFDGRAFYAAKTVSDGNKRYIIGWNPTKAGEKDSGHWEWGGALVVHEVYQRKDGTLACKMPQTIKEAFTQKVPLKFRDERSEYVGGFKLNTDGKAKVVYATEKLDGVYRIDCEFTFKKGTNRLGLLLNTDEAGDASYGYFIDPMNDKMVFELFPNFPQYSLDAIRVERPVKLKEGQKCKLSVIVQDTVCVAYLNDELALNSRMYDSQTGIIGFMVQGDAEFKDIQIYKL